MAGAKISFTGTESAVVHKPGDAECVYISLNGIQMRCWMKIPQYEKIAAYQNENVAVSIQWDIENIESIGSNDKIPVLIAVHDKGEVEAFFLPAELEAMEKIFSA